METTKISCILPSLATDPTISTTETATNFNKEHKRNNEQDNIQHNNKKARLKPPPTNFHDVASCLFKIPADLLPKIASFLRPFDAYHLGQCCKRFCNDNPLYESKKLNFHFKSVARGLLNASLVSSLDNVLKFNDAGFDVTKFHQLCATLESLGFPEGTIQISGSTMVQAALGKPFKNKTDIDLYVSEDAAPIVRTWLTCNDGANLLFGGIKSSSFYDGQRDLRRFLKSDNGEISHVEEYCKMPENADKPTFLRRTKDKNLAWWRKVDYTKGTVFKMYDNATAKHIHLNVAPIPGKKLRMYRNFLKEVDIDTPTPYDSVDSEEYWPSHGIVKSPHKIDLVLARSNFTPKDLIDKFDLNICKISYNGKTFCIPDAANTFKSLPSQKVKGGCVHKPATLITRDFNTLKTVFQGEFRPISTAHRLFCLEQECHVLKNGHVYLKYLWSKGYHFGNTTVPSAKIIDKRTREHRYYVMAIHKHLAASIQRLNKYRCRGIDIVDIMPNLVLLMTDHSASATIRPIRYQIPAF